MINYINKQSILTNMHEIIKEKMVYDIIFVLGEKYFDHPLSGPAILKRLLEKYGFSVGIIDNPRNDNEVTILGKPRLFFAVSSGSIDSMLKNYNALKRPRSEDPNEEFTDEYTPDRAVIVYCNWIRQNFKDSILVIGGVEATLRRFTHYDYWDNKLRKPILVDSRSDILCYGNSEKQIIEIATKLKEFYDESINKEYDNKKNSIIINARIALHKIPGTCIILKTLPEDINVKILPSYKEVSESKEQFCEMQNAFTNEINLAQQVDDRYIVQYKSPEYTPKDLDEYYELPFTRKIPFDIVYLRGFQFSVVTHRGCVGECNFCSLTLTQGNKIISRSEESILHEIEQITKLEHFRGNIDDLGGPAANMYGMDCIKCKNSCINCKTLCKDNKRLIELLKKARVMPGIKHVYIRSGIRFDLCSEEYLREVITHHIADTLRIAPEHIDKNILKLMNKDYGDLSKFIEMFNKIASSDESIVHKELSFYFMTAHPGSEMKHAQELSKFIKNFRNSEAVQIFTPTPMTISTCMYYTGMDPKTKKKIYVPYTFVEKKNQKRIIQTDF
ncbi:MAG: YgiQ family radical SAM protein [Candidatus Woesearchaeota archaeon]